MTDPYCWPGSDCPRNKLNLRDKDRLASAEARIVSIRDVELARETLPGEYNLEHLKAFHRKLFQDVYDWAGETRTVDISRPGARFSHWRYVDDEVSAVLHELTASDGLLIGYTRTMFVARLAYYYGEINARHAFREGNGRTQRAFLRQLSAVAGWQVDWSGVDPQTNEAACLENLLRTTTDQLEQMLDPVVSRI